MLEIGSQTTCGHGLFELGGIGIFSGFQLREIVFSFHVGHAHVVYQGLVRTHIISFRKANDRERKKLEAQSL